VRYPRGSHKRLRGAERQAERLAEMYKERESLLFVSVKTLSLPPIFGKKQL
jgi:hypothetical protein